MRCTLVVSIKFFSLMFLKSRKEPNKFASMSDDGAASPEAGVVVGESTGSMQCAICLEPLSSSDANKAELQCAHVFHASCLLPWVLSGKSTCPSCRQCTHEEGFQLGHLTLMARASYLRRTIGRRRDAPEDLVRLIQNLKKAESLAKEAAKQASLHRRQNKSVYARGVYLRRKKWRLERNVRFARALLGTYNSDVAGLPGLLIQSNR